MESSQSQQTMAITTEPIYPYFRSIPLQSTPTATGESSTHVEIIPAWRALLPSETGLEGYCSQKLPPEFVERLRCQFNTGRKISEDGGDWETAAKSFLDLRDMIREVEHQLEKQTFDFLLAWADLPLAQLYQSQGGADMLKKTMDMRKEILDCVMPLQRSHELLVRLCKTYYYTARYEWGELMSLAEAKSEAIEEYAELLECNKCEGEAQICFLLCVDHEYSGSSEASLRWIHEANRLWKKNPREGSGCKYYFLVYEVKLLMRLRKFSEAVDVLINTSTILEDSTQNIEFVLDQDDRSEVISEVRDMLQECYTHMSSEAADKGDFQQANHYEGLVELQHAFQLSLDGAGAGNEAEVQELTDAQLSAIAGGGESVTLASCANKFLAALSIDQVGNEVGDVNVLFRNHLKLRKLIGQLSGQANYFGEIESHEFVEIVEVLQSPMMKRTPSLLGSSLGLVQARDDFMFLILAKLPKPILSIIKFHLYLAQAAWEICDWEVSTYHYEQIRELLKITKKLLDQKTYDWLLSMYDLTLESLYHYRLRKIRKAVEMWQEIEECSTHLSQPDHEFLKRHYSIRMVSAVSVEWLYEGNPYQAASLAESQNSPGNLMERCSCFWLYLLHYTHGNYDLALKWLREEKRLTEAYYASNLSDRSSSGTFDPPEKKHGLSGADSYFCVNCDYDYFRCEADLLMRLKKFEEAKTTLKNLLNTEHIQQGSRKLAREANKWLRYCIQCMFHGEERAELQLALALEYSLIDDCNHKHESACEIAEQIPSPTGCTVDSDDEVVQSQAGLEHHLDKLPVPLQLAFRRHAYLGRSHQEMAEWEDAISEWEWCKEILRTFEVPNIDKRSMARDWLMVWVSVPLAGLYQFKKREVKRALDLWREILKIIPDELTKLRSALRLLEFSGMYEYSLSNYPDFKNGVVKLFSSLFGSGLSGDHWVREDQLLTFLSLRYFKIGSVEVALRFVRQAKQLFELQPSGHEHGREKSYYVGLEYICLHFLGKLDEVVPDDTQGSTFNDLTPKILKKLLGNINAGNYASAVAYAEYYSMRSFFQITESELNKLRTKTLELRRNNKYAEAIECYEKSYVTVIDKTCNGGGLEMSFHPELQFYDYGFLSRMSMRLFLLIIDLPNSSFRGEQIKAFRQNANFLRAVQYAEKFIECSSSSSASGNVSLARIYGAIDDQYAGRYLQSLFHQVPRNPFTGYDTSDPKWFHACNEVKTYLNLEIPVQKYGDRAVSQHANFLYNTESNIYAEGWTKKWIDFNEEKKSVFALLQMYLWRRIISFSLLDGRVQILPGYNQREILTCQWKAFMYAEAERAQAMVFQLLGSDSSKRREWSFNRNLNTIRENRATLFKGDFFFVEYSTVSSPSDDTQYKFAIYTMDQDGRLSVKCSIMEYEEDQRTFEKRLKNLHRYFETPGKNQTARSTLRSYDDASMIKDLEALYDMLIRPIAHHLDKLKPEQKLILAPSEVLTKVPFAALRNKKDGRYLIERHTIALIPSLMVLQKCDERLRALQSSSHPSTDRGSIVALGDPAYVCRKCTKANLQRLEGSGKEVESIAKLFGDQTPVVKLLREDATAEQLLHWAAKPSHDSFRQAIVHIGAHGVVDEKDLRKTQSVSLQLACKNPAGSAHNGLPASNGASTSSRIRGKQIVDEQIEDDYTSDEDVVDSDDEADTMIKSSSVSSYDLVMESTVLRQLEASQASSSSSIDTRNMFRRSADSMSMRSRAGISVQCGLKGEDISNSETKWRAELVVISACQSARGRVTTEGVLSMARAFMVAGVPCVVASLWKVNDKATAPLMEKFYEELRKGSDVASSLRSAMLHRMRTHRHEVNLWAPFNVYGVPSLRIPKSLQLQQSASTSQAD